MSESRVSEFDERRIASARAAGAALSATVILTLLAGAKVLFQFSGIRRYGFFRDELYYMACGEHLAWGYVDQPPLIALFAWLTRHLLGNSIFAIRLLPVLAGAAVVFLTGLLARELGGGRFAQFLLTLPPIHAPPDSDTNAPPRGF